MAECCLSTYDKKNQIRNNIFLVLWFFLSLQKNVGVGIYVVLIIMALPLLSKFCFVIHLSPDDL